MLTFLFIMQRLNHYQMLHAILSQAVETNLEIEVETFNKFASQLKRNNILCTFDYCDLEDYAYTLSNAYIEYSRIVISSSSSWLNDIQQLAGFYDMPVSCSKIFEVWNEVLI